MTDEMFRSTGESDYGAAVSALDAEFGWSKRRSLVLLHEGMSGGFQGIARARNFLRHELLRHPRMDSHRPASPAPQLHVAVHARLGDFHADRTGPRPGVFNACLPTDWYRSVLTAVRTHFGDAMRVDVMSDDPARAARILPEWSRSSPAPQSSLEDLSVMADADLLICSVSSFSMLAAFLSDAPYLWYRPHLGEMNGFLSVWGHEDHQRACPTTANIEVESRDDMSSLPTRGVPMDLDEDLPDWLTEFLATKLALKRRSADLIHNGVVRQSPRCRTAPAFPGPSLQRPQER
ncbi:hypothetical protein [Streptomyces sp. MK5]|uniref:hypothetical protein n=1 Tax=Streptomyces sp. MK5 TaxID=3064253 RepID=UPI002741F579|nr:hypothetical protein [Streptomyces sp. MK5]